MGYTVDKRLIAKVEQRAASKVHDAAGKIQVYIIWAAIANNPKYQKDRREIARIEAARAEIELRRFMATL